MRLAFFGSARGVFVAALLTTVAACSLAGLTSSSTSPDASTSSQDASIDATISPDDATADAPHITIDATATDAGTDANALSPYAAMVLSDSPILYYRLDETSGATVATDLSPSHINSTYGSRQTLGATGLIFQDTDTAVITSHDDAGTAFKAPRNLKLEYTTALTLECWTKIAATPTDGVLFEYGGEVNGTHYGYELTFIYPTEQATIQFITSLNDGYPVRENNLFASTRYYIAATYDGATATLYVDGAEKATLTSDAGIAYDLTSGLSIGSNADGTAPSSGTIDELAIYPTALSAARIAAHYQCGINQICN